MGRTTLWEQEDAPMHPAIRRWLVAYARTPDDEKDAVVGQMLTELNALLLGGSPIADGRDPSPEVREASSPH